MISTSLGFLFTTLTNSFSYLHFLKFQTKTQPTITRLMDSTIIVTYTLNTFTVRGFFVVRKITLTSVVLHPSSDSANVSLTEFARLQTSLGNRGHLDIFKIMSRWMSSIWERFKDPWSFIMGGTHASY